MSYRHRILKLSAAVFLLASCSSTSPAVYGPVDVIGDEAGYYPRVETTGPDAESLFILTFSGGGKRASAYAQGVLEALKSTDLADGRTMLDEVDMISSVSGGSVPAANFVIHGADSFDRFRTDFLYYDAMARLKQELLYTPAVIWSLLVENHRIEAFVNILEERLAGDDVTYATLRKNAPYLILNTTDIATGLGFPLTQYQFDLICSDLGQMPLARAIAASAAYPVLLSSIAIENKAPCPAQFREGEPQEAYARNLVPPLAYAGLMADRASPEHAATQPPIFRAGSAYKRERGQRMLRYLESEQDYRYLHLYDGGINDNVGLAEPLWLLTDTGGSWKATLNRYLNGDHLKRVTVLSANARSDPDSSIPEEAASPGMIGTISAVIGSSIDRRSTGLINQLALTTAIRKDLRWGDMGFDRIKDRRCAGRFANLPTDWALDRNEVNALIMLGAAMTFGTEAYRDQAHASGAVLSAKAMQHRSTELVALACSCISIRDADNRDEQKVQCDVDKI